MAHVEKYDRSSVSPLAIHYERREGHQLSNQDIDASKSWQNYNLAQDLQPLTPEQFVKKRLSEVHHMNRKNLVVMVDWIVTLPKDVKKEDEDQFFIHTYDFLTNKYGKENVIGAYVHKDEKTPHIHFSFVPVIEDDGIEKFLCKKIITKANLKTFHTELSSYIEEHLGYPTEILNDATINGNKTIKELKRQEDLSFQKSISNITEHIAASDEIIAKAEDIDFKPSSLIEKRRSLKKSNEVIDELKLQTKTLQMDTKTLTNMVVVQKSEIDMYRSMPLAKQLKAKDNEISLLNDSIEELKSDIEERDYQSHRLSNELKQSKNKVEKYKEEKRIVDTFLSAFGLNKVYEKFKRMFVNNNYTIDFRTMVDLGNVLSESLNKAIQTLKNKIKGLDKNPNLSITPKNIEKEER